MKNTTLTLSFNTEKLDALTFHMGKKDADLQGELNDTIQKLYEKYVPQATREYIDDKVSRDAEAKNLASGDRPPPPPFRLILLRRRDRISASDKKPATPPVSAPVTPRVGFFPGRVASMYPCGWFRQRWGACGCSPKKAEKPCCGWISGGFSRVEMCELKGLCCFRSLTLKHCPAKPCGGRCLNTFC